ncbi:carbon-nitrogen hydrolase family protein [Thalassotalea mangrovi]|uniref:Carbon-nitrogen hydrolase family protein n=1 Tax=Thalassotalea mangrovi TaxID=2572245 RepID=A0A4U1B5K1_9GAMM|nr:carbon-nitrogen hydrolase family protein [Thalassotalea mangrovi]TKB45388.1 carbon-nitrogen hydrolase family protein [Thalassotalea mangrovi]
MSTFMIAGLQLNLVNNEDNFYRIQQQVVLAKKRFLQLDMVVLSELATFGSAPRFAQSLPGDAEQRYCQLAMENEIYLVTGSLYQRINDQIYNTCSVISPHGEVICRYQKIYPFLPYETGISSGNEFTTFNIPGVGCFGLSICYDMWFPETVRALCYQGAEVIIHPTLTNTIDRDVELSISRANAAMNQCYMVDINATGELAVGKSIVVGPGGEVIHQAQTNQELILFEVDFDYLRRVREQGWQGLGQPLKSFRDKTIEFPQYQKKLSTSALNKLGPLQKPTSPNLDSSQG